MLFPSIALYHFRLPIAVNAILPSIALVHLSIMHYKGYQYSHQVRVIGTPPAWLKLLAFVSRRAAHLETAGLIIPNSSILSLYSSITFRFSGPARYCCMYGGVAPGVRWSLRVLLLVRNKVVSHKSEYGGSISRSTLLCSSVKGSEETLLRSGVLHMSIGLHRLRLIPCWLRWIRRQLWRVSACCGQVNTGYWYMDREKRSRKSILPSGCLVWYHRAHQCRPDGFHPQFNFSVLRNPLGLGARFRLRSPTCRSSSTLPEE